MSRELILEWSFEKEKPPQAPVGPVPEEGPRQLSLFTPERLDLGEAWEALASLDLDRGLALFEGLASRYPTSREAQDGLAIARFWQPVLAAARGLEPIRAVATIWSSLRERAPRDRLLTDSLKRALAERLVTLLREVDVLFFPRDLARGALELWLGRLSAARADLRAACVKHPDEPAVLVPLAEAEWRLGHCAAARAVWARLLLVAPHAQLGPSAPADLLDVMARHGAEWAPHRGWLEGVLPLVKEVPAAPAGSSTAAYGALVAAETARCRQDLDAAVAARMLLRRLAPELLAAYVARLEGAPGR
jgi:hypothetical protein